MATFDLENDTLNNTNYRKVLFTIPNGIQLVLMTLPPGEIIDKEVHNIDQFIRVENGQLRVVTYTNDVPTTHIISAGGAVIIPRNTTHEIFNDSTTEQLKLYTIYTEAQHKPNTVQIVRPTNEEHEHENGHYAKTMKYMYKLIELL